MKQKSFFTFFGLLLCAFSMQIAAQTLDFQGAARQRALLKQEALPTAETNLLPPPSAKTAGASLAPQIGGLDQSFAGNITDGTATVNATAVQADGKILVGGFFSSVDGATRRCLERLNPDGTRDATFNPGGAGANGTVYVIIPLASGKFLIGGTFTLYNGSSVGRIARLNADGSLDATFRNGSGANNSIQDIIIQPDGKMLVSGNFVTFDGVTRNRVARLNADGSLDTVFNPNVSGFVEEMALQPDGKILIGGIFTTVGTTTRLSVARLNPDGTVDATFDPAGGGVRNASGDTGSVYALELQPDGKILIGGDFDYYGIAPRPNLARINADGSLDVSFAPATGQISVEFFAVEPDGKILVAGNFGSGSVRYALVRLNADGTNDAGFTPTPLDDFGYVVTRQADGKIILGGYFTNGVKRLNADGSVDANFNPAFKLEATVRAIKVQPNGKILVAGDFRFVNGAPRRNIARLNADGSLDASFDPGFGADNAVYAVALQADGKILIGGLFFSYNRTDRNLIARLNADGSLDESFDFRDAQGAVYDVKVQADGKILLGGYFGSAETQINTGFVRLTSSGAYDAPPFGFFGTDSYVMDVEMLPNGKYLIGGNFTVYGNAPRSRVARVNADLSLDTTFNPGSGANSGTIWDVAPLANGQAYVAGGFTSFNGNGNYQDVARLNADGSPDPSFATVEGFNGSANVVLPLADGTILVGGNFYSYRGFPLSHLVQLNANAAPLTGYAYIPFPDFIYFIFDLAMQPDGKVLVGGRFVTYTNPSRGGIFRLQAVQRGAAFDFDGDRRADFSVFRPSDRTWYLSRSTAGFGAVQFGLSNDKLTPADYDGDGRTDISVFRDGTWYWIRSSDGGVGINQFGQAGDVPQPGDYDGDGKADLAVFRQGVWYVLYSANAQTNVVSFGLASDKAVAADYDGDGANDFAVFRDGTWWVLRSSNGQSFAVQFGVTGDKPVPADYDGDGRTDFAVYRGGTWWILRSGSGVASSVQFGLATDVPAPADFDGDARADIAVYRDGTWYVQKTSDGAYIIAQFGLAGDAPTPASFVP